MASFGTSLGKGMAEPCSPYRTFNIFGAQENPPGGENWNCLPSIVGATITFDLSTITEGHEVCLALCRISNCQAGLYTITFKWYRLRDNKLLFTWPFSYSSVLGGWIYAFSYIGWPWEITEDGNYHVNIDVTGTEYFSAVVPFSITGILAGIEPEPPPVGALRWISIRFTEASALFYSLYLEVLGWVWPFYLISDFFYSLSSICADLSWDFYYFNDWILEVADKIQHILSVDNIYSYFKTYFDAALDAWDWVVDAWDTIWSEIDDWWDTIRPTVQGWISATEDWLSDWIDAVEGSLNSLRAAWNEWKVEIPSFNELWAWFGNWWGSVLAHIIAWGALTATQVDTLIDSWFRQYAPFWEGWIDIKDQVIEFFTDPLEWLLGKFTDWFLGPEE